MYNNNNNTLWVFEPMPLHIHIKNVIVTNKKRICNASGFHYMNVCVK